MKRVWLVRHGSVENPTRILYASLPGFHLSAHGQEQAACLGEHVRDAGVRIATIRSSPLERAQETAKAIADATGFSPIEIEPALTEWNMGDWVGKPLEEFYAKCSYYQPEMREPGPETLVALAKRVIAVIEALPETKEDEVSILVAHRESFVSALLVLQGKSFETVHKVDFPVASVWEILYTDDAPPQIQKRFDCSGHNGKGQFASIV